MKRKLMFCIFVVLLLIAILITVCGIWGKKVDYSSKLISVLNEQKETAVREIFSFEFDRAYVFDDCYISGDGFSKRYNLDISIDEVESGVSENIQRIVFVDESGKFVYEFRCDSNKITIKEKGIVIYPETVITRESLIYEEPLTISLSSVDVYSRC